MTRTSKWLVGIASFLLLLIAAVYFFEWNLARPYIARKVTESTGRSFAINGDLDVHLSLRPRIIANDVVMGNAPWSKDPIMAQIKRADFRIDILKLLVVFPPRFSLEFLHACSYFIDFSRCRCGCNGRLRQRSAIFSGEKRRSL